MSEYDFRNLSDYDFEILARDLLSEHLSIHFQNFKRGKDGGVDLRCSNSDVGDVIVQCKHYLRTPISKLISDIKKEYSKIDIIKPKRYILFTSAELSEANKKSIFEELKPYCNDETDIISSEDINYLLGLHPDVERRHPKLWLSSTAVLEKFMNGDIFNRTQILFDEIAEDAAKYVQNSSFSKAVEIINTKKFCIISGIPGIGKTTLAKMLLLKYSMDGYDPYYISEDINEAYKVLATEKRQIIYFDDFLGKTRFNPINLNFDKRLLEFIRAVKRSKNTIFVLTTREYILNQAVEFYEDLELNKSLLDDGKCLIRLSDYTLGQKTLILYNHLYHMHIDKDSVSSLLESGRIYRIVSHTNYLPRIIDWVIRNPNSADGDVLYSKLLNALNDPKEIWRSAFNKHISQNARFLLLLLFSYGSTSVNNLKVAFENFISYMTRLGNASSNSTSFESSLRELQGSFLDINTYDQVVFHNPSVIDYMDEHLNESLNDIYHIIESINDKRQFWHLLLGSKNNTGLQLPRSYAKDLLSLDEVLKKLNECELRLEQEIQDPLPLDDQKFHLDNLKMVSRLIDDAKTSRKLQEILVRYAGKVINTRNILLETAMTDIDYIQELKPLYKHFSVVENAIKNYIRSGISSRISLEGIGRIVDLSNGLEVGQELQGAIFSKLNDVIIISAKEIGDSYSSSNLSRFEDIYYTWQDWGFSNNEVDSALSDAMYNKSLIESGEVEDEDGNYDYEDDFEKEPKEVVFNDDIDYSDVVDLIKSLDSE